MVSKNIRTYRKKNNLTQEELGKKLGVSCKTVSSWEAGRTEPSMGMIEKICEALHCLKTDILGKDNVDYFVTNDKFEIEVLQKLRASDDTTRDMIFRILSFNTIENKEE